MTVDKYDINYKEATMEAVFKFICDYFEESLFFPTLTEIAEEFENAIHSISRKMKKLESEGLIVQQYHGGRYRLNNYDMRRLSIVNVSIYEDEREV